jgi:hypothetical protein
VQEPILTFEGRDLIVCATASEAEGQVEAYDVASVEAYDSAGQVLRFEADGWRTVLRETGAYQPERLRSAICVDHLVSMASERFSEENSLTLLGRLGRKLFNRSE